MPQLLARFICLIKSFLSWQTCFSTSEDNESSLATEIASPTAGEVEINPPSPISRFIYESDKYRKGSNLPKPGAFMPEQYEDRWETSVCRIGACDEERVWYLGRTRRPDRTLRARIDFDVQHVIDNTLACNTAPQDGYDEHAVVIDWPPTKEAQKLIAVKLAAAVGACTLAPATGEGNATGH
ncbi:hypothetical protein ACS0X5_10780 [Burkholderia gladioli]|uniref:hypothetical protein n=1 Tax=Burkholderia gladioli TaxID=28095 RepID=UPI003F794154